MKLIYRVLTHLTLALTIILGIWGLFFYFTLIDELNDETDNSLEDYSELIITQILSGQELSAHSDGIGSSYHLSEVSREYARQTPYIRYSNENIYIPERAQTEPARTQKTIFKDNSDKYFELTLSILTIEKKDLQEAILKWVVFLYLILLASILIINIWVFHGSMKPLYTLLKWLDNYTLGKNNLPPDCKTNITEFKKLNEAAIRSANRNQLLFEQQKQFISNASHELQTPLAICQNRLEILTENEAITEEQLNQITKIQQTLSYIIRLNKSLLFLSKIENEQFSETKAICLNTIIHQQLENYQDIYTYKKITVEIEEDNTSKVEMNETLATTLITNFLKNAYVHNIQGGHIKINISGRNLKFCNTGAPEALDEQQIFRRFHQGKNSGEGSGLGLSIAEAISRLYNISMRYSYDGEHCFELNFPTILRIK